MKTIQITIDDKLLAELKRALKGQARLRSAFIRRAIRRELEMKRTRELEEQQIRGYQKYPVGKDEFSTAPEFLAWGDPWDEDEQ